VESKDVKAYWEERAAGDSSPQSTTLDYYLRDIEFRVLSEQIERHAPSRVMDIGCGDAYTTLRLARRFPHIEFVGGDYARPMIKNAAGNAAKFETKNVDLLQFDVLSPSDIGQFDFVYTSRCIINVVGWDKQKAAFRSIHGLLRPAGVYCMLENFMDGQAALNEVRQSFGLDEIKVRDHNCFLQAEYVDQFLGTAFDIVENLNISSSYYLVSRVIYSKICQIEGVQPNYFDKHHELASKLPFCGNYGPVKMLVLIKKAGVTLDL
jgi:SAM-dependent methyltransferase